MYHRGIQSGPDVPPILPVILAALFCGAAYAGGPATYTETFTERVSPGAEIVEGTITNATCTLGAAVTTIHVDGNPADAPDVFRQLARCDVSEITFEDRSGRFDQRAFDRELLTYFDARTLHACSSLGECGIRVDTICRREGSTGKSSALELDSRSTATGEACTGTCADGTKVRVLCIKADPRLQV